MQPNDAISNKIRMTAVWAALSIRDIAREVWPLFVINALLLGALCLVTVRSN